MWQLLQPLATATLAWKRPLPQVLKPPLWQLSQLAAAAAGTDAYGM